MEINDYDPIADIYDIYVPATFDIDFFIQETKNISGEVLELMSGSGRITIPLLEEGVKLTCVDISASLNEILEDKLHRLDLKADVHQMDVCELDLQKKFEMVIIPFHSFAHITKPVDQVEAIARIKEHLVSGGTFICTLANPAIRQKPVNGQLRLLRKYPLPNTGGTLLLWVVENNNSEDDKIIEALQFYEEYDSRGVLISKRLLELHFRLTSREEFEALATAAGFKVKSFFGDYSYAEFNQESPFMIWILENSVE